MTATAPSLIERLDRLIDENLDDPQFSIDTICQTLGVSRSQLHRSLKSHSPLSTSLYIRQRRLLKAKYLLQTTDLRISEICDLVGMGNPQNFSTYFTEEFGSNPSEFRRYEPETVDVPTSEGVLQPAPAMPVEEIRAHQTPAWTSRRWQYGRFMIGLLLLVGVGLLVWFYTQPAKRTEQPGRLSIAILPFTNLGPPDTNPACDGIMDDVHTSISVINTLNVISRSSSDKYRSTTRSIWQIGDELQVANLLKGSVLKIGDQIQIKVELLDTQEDIRIWGNTYSAAYRDIFKLTDQIVRDVAGQLERKPTPTEATKIDRLPTRNLEAYGEYIKGKHLMLARTPEKLRASVEKFDHAIALDTTFADAYVARAAAYLIMSDFGGIDKQEGLKQSESNTLKAIRLDATNGTAYGVLANLYRMQNKWEQALLTFQIALKHSPNDAQTNFWYGIALRSIGRFEESIRYETRAVTLNPLYPAALIGLISTCSNAGRHDLALKAIQDGELLFNDNYMYHYARSFYHLTLGEKVQAVAAMRVSDSLSHSIKGISSYRLYLRGQTLPRTSFLTELQRIPSTPENYYDLAFAYAGLADKEQCLRYLQLAVDHDRAPDYLKVTPQFTFLHNDPRFTRILRQCNL